MVSRVGFLHAHFSNIAYIERLLPRDAVEPVHFVDPGLMWRIGADATFASDGAGTRVKDQLAWMACCGLSAIVITCTNYIAAMGDAEAPVSMPVIKIDEPFFVHMAERTEPQLLVFTNPATVDGTMRRLRESASRRGLTPDISIQVIDRAFDLFMRGEKAEHDALVAGELRQLIETSHGAAISVGQLSMVDAALNVEAETGVRIGDPLRPLMRELEQTVSRL